MSKFSGKCDLYDILISIKQMNDNSDWSKVKINMYIDELDEYGYNKYVPLNINCIKDLVPYFPFIETSAADNKDVYTCLIGKYSFVYLEEQEQLKRILKRAQKEYRKCKKNKEEFIIEEVSKKIMPFGIINENIIEICKRVKEHPYSTKLNDLHTPLHNHFRNDLMEEMIKYGYTKEQAYEWCYNNTKIW